MIRQSGIRRFGQPPLAGARYTLRPGVYAILPKGRELLLTVQEATERELQLPGGGIDPGESPLQALHREVMEETGWTIAAPRRIGAFRRFTWMPDYQIMAEKLCTIYLAHPVRQICPPKEPGHETLWGDWDFAQKYLTNTGDRHFVQQMAGMWRR